MLADLALIGTLFGFAFLAIRVVPRWLSRRAYGTLPEWTRKDDAQVRDMVSAMLAPGRVQCGSCGEQVEYRNSQTSFESYLKHREGCRGDAAEKP